MNKTVLTGVKPTHIPHLGNYLGAMRPSIELGQEADNALLFIADYHALNTVQDPKLMREYTHQVTATWVACGVSPENTMIYRQSDVPEICELNWILSTVTPKGLMNRAHAYKAKVQENQQAGKEDLDDGVSMGLFCYPILMSADILLFNADVVPTGEDQVQHIEIARDVAQKFNRLYGETFKLPKAHVQVKKNVPGLDGRKMSKSYGNHIPLFLDSKKLRKMIMKIVTDSTPPEAPKDPQNSVIFDLYKEFAPPEKIQALEARYHKGIGWGEAKQELFEAIEHHFREATEVYNDLMENPIKLDKILKRGAIRARDMAEPMIQKVRKAVRGL